MTNAQFLARIKGFPLERWIKKTWNRLPPEARKVLLKFWGEEEKRGKPLKFIMIKDFSSSYKKKSHAKYVAASTTLREFRFSKYMFDEIEEPAALGIIAHEFAHAYRGAKGLEDANLARCKTEYEGFKSEEALVDKLVAKWGFSVQAVDLFFEVFKIKHDPKHRKAFEDRVKNEINRRLKDSMKRLDVEMKAIMKKAVRA